MKTQYQVIKSGKGFRIQFTYENGIVGIFGGEKTRKYFFKYSEIAERFCIGMNEAEKYCEELEKIEVLPSEVEAFVRGL